MEVINMKMPKWFHNPTNFIIVRNLFLVHKFFQFASCFTLTYFSYFRVDADFLIEKGAIPKEKVRSVIVEGCPMAVMNKVCEVYLKLFFSQFYY